MSRIVVRGRGDHAARRAPTRPGARDHRRRDRPRRRRGRRDRRRQGPRRVHDDRRDRPPAGPLPLADPAARVHRRPGDPQPARPRPGASRRSSCPAVLAHRRHGRSRSSQALLGLRPLASRATRSSSWRAALPAARARPTGCACTASATPSACRTPDRIRARRPGATRPGGSPEGVIVRSPNNALSKRKKWRPDRAGHRLMSWRNGVSPGGQERGFSYDHVAGRFARRTGMHGVLDRLRGAGYRD